MLVVSALEREVPARHGWPWAQGGQGLPDPLPVPDPRPGASESFLDSQGRTPQPRPGHSGVRPPDRPHSPSGAPKAPRFSLGEAEGVLGDMCVQKSGIPGLQLPWKGSGSVLPASGPSTGVWLGLGAGSCSRSLRQGGTVLTPHLAEPRGSPPPAQPQTAWEQSPQPPGEVPVGPLPVCRLRLAPCHSAPGRPNGAVSAAPFPWGPGGRLQDSRAGVGFLGLRSWGTWGGGTWEPRAWAGSLLPHHVPAGPPAGPHLPRALPVLPPEVLLGCPISGAQL